MRYRYTALSLMVLLPISVPAQPKQEEKKAPPPQVVVTVPFAVELGKTTKLTVRGLRLDTVTDIRLHEPHSSGKILGKPKKIAVPNQVPVERVGDSEIEIEITVAKEVAGGTVPFSLVGPGNVESKAYALLVMDDTPRIAEKEPNDAFKTAQSLQLPCVVEGSIRQNQDVDIYQIVGKAGQKLEVELQAARYGSPLDGILTLFNAQGGILATVGETAMNPDATLKFTLPHDGVYYLSLIDAHDLGSNIHIYRLIVRNQR